jgi:uncharacterized OsmC-like protein
MDESQFTIELSQQADYRFETRFDRAGVPALISDEAPPLGADAGPNPDRLLVAAIANCLCASLLFALRKFKNEPGPMHARGSAIVLRNEHQRLRIGRVDVEVRLGVAAAELKQLERALAQFEDFCTVTQSVRAAFPVGVRVLDSAGVLLGP